jgi:hypothetical protein
MMKELIEYIRIFVIIMYCTTITPILENCFHRHPSSEPHQQSEHDIVDHINCFDATFSHSWPRQQRQTVIIIAFASLLWPEQYGKMVACTLPFLLGA